MGASTAPPVPIFEVPRLPPGHSPPEIMAALPWMAGWILPDRAAGAGLPPRDILRTPFALGLMRLPPEGGPLFAAPPAPVSPPAVLRRLAHLLFFSQAASLRQQEPLLAAIGGGDPLARVEAAMAPAALAACGRHGQVPLTLAALLGRRDVVQRLLAAGAPVDACDGLGNSALHWAAIAEDDVLETLLRSAGADPSRENLMGGRPQDYRAGWRRQGAARPNIVCVARDGRRFTPVSREAFIAEMGFEYLEHPRPSIDFFMHMLFGMWRADWRQTVCHQMMRLGHFPRQAPPMPPLVLKDFGEPWGWGVCAGQAVPKGSPVTTYSGDLVHAYEMLTERLNWGDPIYTCNTMPNPVMQDCFMSVIDARRSGNLGSRVNSSHTKEAGNLASSCRFWRGLPEVRFVAGRDIAAHEQLCWYYGDTYWRERKVKMRPLPPF